MKLEASLLPSQIETDFFLFWVQYRTFLRRLGSTSSVLECLALNISSLRVRQLEYFFTFTVWLSLQLFLGTELYLFLEALLTIGFLPLPLLSSRLLSVGLLVRLESWLNLTGGGFQRLYSYFSTILYTSLLYSWRVSLVLSLTSILGAVEHSTKSLLLQNARRQGCWAIQRKVGLFSGLKLRVLLSRSKASPEQSPTICLRLMGFILVRMSSICLPKSVLRERRSSMVGGPVQVSTLSIWLRVECPGNIALPASSSPSRHPKLQTSAAFEYCLDPSRISGALYQRVAMYSVRRGSESGSYWRERTSPKSHTLAWQSWLRRTLEGLMSRWMSCAEWRQWKAVASWQAMYCLCCSPSTPSLMSPCRSISMSSNSRQMSFSLSARITSLSCTMLGCCTCWRRVISRQVLWASVEFWKASKFFLRAYLRPLPRSTTSHTTPQAPLPILLLTSNRSRICSSSHQLSLITIRQHQNHIQYQSIPPHSPNVNSSRSPYSLLFTPLPSKMCLHTRGFRWLSLRFPGESEEVDLACGLGGAGRCSICMLQFLLDLGVGQYSDWDSLMVGALRGGCGSGQSYCLDLLLLFLHWQGEGSQKWEWVCTRGVLASAKLSFLYLLRSPCLPPFSFRLIKYSSSIIYFLPFYPTAPLPSLFAFYFYLTPPYGFL